ncbi:MAG: hypothetical protein Q4G04_05225 [bacterium]|nr:hypothetical protein [bacterium]
MQLIILIFGWISFFTITTITYIKYVRPSIYPNQEKKEQPINKPIFNKVTTKKQPYLYHTKIATKKKSRVLKRVKSK